MQEQSQKRSEFHFLQCLPHAFQSGRIYRRTAGDDPGTGVHHMLGHIKDSHGDVESVRDQQNCHEGLEDPFEENPGLKVGQVIVIDNHLDQLIAGDEGEDHACNRDDDGL